MTKQIHNFIDGKWQAPNQDRYLKNLNPATGEELAAIPDSDETDVEKAVRAAGKAFLTWSRLKPADRSQYLHAIADQVEERKQEFAELESLDQGKPVHLAKHMDMDRVIQNFRFFADLILQPHAENYELAGLATSRVVRHPVGIAGLISPWNLPLYLLSWKMAPALACGNTVICKPSEFTSLTAALLCDIVSQVGVPAGVINMVFGRGETVGDALVRHPEIPLISFTGGTETGKKVIRASADHFKKLSLELGGKNPNIIFADADYSQALKTTLRSSFLNQGEICLCGSRIYVEAPIFEKFLNDFVEETEKLTVGDPFEEKTFMGALVSEAHLKKVESYIDLAKKEGGEIRAGGKRPALPEKFRRGYFLRPTIITGLEEGSRCVQEEIFGPVVTIVPFHTEAEVIEKANGVRYGLSASIWTLNPDRQKRVAEQLKVGTVWVNSWLVRDLRVPFGGMKHSGLGREGGWHSFEFFTEPTTVCTKLEKGHS